MTQRRSDLLVGVAGVSTVVGFVLGFGVLVGLVPGPDASASEVGEFLRRPAGQIWSGGYVGLLGALAFLVFAAALFRALCEPEASPSWVSLVGFGAAVAQLAVTVAGDLLPGATAFYSGSKLDPTVVSAMFDQKKLAEILATPLMGVFLVCVALMIRHSKAMPAWLGWSAAFIGLVSFVAVPFGFDAVQIPALLTLLWILTVSVRALIDGVAP